MTINTDELQGDFKKLKSPCNECPFIKTITPGATGGSEPDAYIGQGHGPFWLPCHKNCDFSDPEWKSDYKVQQCAGAAIYRANVGISSRLPVALMQLPPSDKVFESPVELYAHHKQVSLEEAAKYLTKNTPHSLMLKEFEIAHNLNQIQKWIRILK